MTHTVLHVHPGNLFGGIETVMLTIARHAQPDQQHAFALCFDGRLARELADTGAAVSRLSPARLSRPWTVWRTRREASRLLASARPDVVLCHSAWSYVVFGPAVRRAKLPVALWLHGPPSRNGWLDRLAARRAPDRLIANSHHTARAAAGFYGLLPAVIYPPAEAPAPGAVATRASLRESLGVTPHTCVVLLVSRLEEWKGHRLLLEALACLPDSPPWACWVVGGAQRPAEHRYLDTLGQQAARLGIERRVQFLGERRDVCRLMAAADVFCQPNAEPEPFGIVFIEALDAGLPVVTTDMGGAREIVTPECGVLVPPAETQALSDALTGLVGDSARRSELGARGPARARELCDPARQLRRLSDALQRAPHVEFAGPRT